MNPKIHFSIGRITAVAYPEIAMPARATDLMDPTGVNALLSALLSASCFGSVRIFDRTSLNAVETGVKAGIFGRGSCRRFFVVCAAGNCLRFVAPLFVRSKNSSVMVLNYDILSCAKLEAGDNDFLWSRTFEDVVRWKRVESELLNKFFSRELLRGMAEEVILDTLTIPVM